MGHATTGDAKQIKSLRVVGYYNENHAFINSCIKYIVLTVRILNIICLNFTINIRIIQQCNLKIGIVEISLVDNIESILTYHKEMTIIYQRKSSSQIMSEMR